MRLGRAKAVRKTLAFFQRTIGIVPPFHILLDATFVVAVTKYKILPLHDRLHKLLQHTMLRLTMARSSLTELELLIENSPPDKKEILQEAYQWALQQCDEILDEIPSPSSHYRQKNQLSEAGKDMLNLVSHENNASKYFLASQDDQLLDQIRRLGCVPILRLANNSVLLLEQPSKTANKHDQAIERRKWTVKGSVLKQEKALVDIVKEQERSKQLAQSSASLPTVIDRQKRKAKGPNPLSCKKKGSKDSESSGNKRKRRRKNKLSESETHEGTAER